ncbi:helix-turn-helix domain-containing protein [Cohnella herbarum]|uniref:AraC family transcriptional regulator n=1 Tax=Cohnella herbarum TaxID=2728023 RepID=A0A7Z2VN47_9BACL|nr:helix-turn-helix domain-containing protein [Cohnella herbarum]QJD86143.1 AraC family transcriptional regulator [Cohnella herbarum]
MGRLANMWRVSFRSIFFRFIILFVSISVLIQIINFVTYNVYLQYVQTRIERNYDSSLSNVAASLNHLFEGIYQSNFLLSLDPSVLSVFSGEGDAEGTAKYADISQSVRSLARIKYIDSSIDSAYIFKRKDDLIISNEGTYSASYFYDKVYRFEEYPAEFWKTHSSGYKLFSILPPSQTSGSERNEGKVIIPIVQSKIAEYWSNNLYVINLNAQYIVRLLQDYKLTPGSVLFIADKNGTMLASSEPDFVRNPELQAFMGSLLEAPDSKSQAVYKKQKMRVVTLNTNFFYNDVVMIAGVPENDIRSSLSNMEKLRWVSAIFTLLLSLILSVAFSKNLYAPIKSLVDRLNGPQTKGKRSMNEFEYLNDEIGRIMNNVQTLNQQLSYALPLANEQFLVKMLKYNYLYDDVSVEAYQKNGSFSFENDHFMIALFQFNFRKPFYDSFNESFQNDSSRMLTKLLTSLLPMDYPCYLLEMDSHLFCLLVNVPEGADQVLYQKYCEDIVELFRKDEDFLRVHAGIGSVRRGYKGMRQSYIEAMKALWRISPFDGKRVYTFTEADNEHDVTRYLLSKEDENRLFNLLLSGKKEELHGLLKQIIGHNLSAGITAPLLRELYMRFYMIGLQVLKQRDRELDGEIGKSYTGFILSNESPSVDEITESIFAYFENVATVCGESQDKFDVGSFKAFISQHYHEDIHLEMLAEKYNTSAQYMSRLLKRELGVGFQEYLLDLRIRKAKELLAQSERKIGDIWEAVGFNNRNTFIRAFKGKEGITPSEYRSNMSK